MTTQTISTDYPQWPPGMWRRIVLQPGPGWIGGALEDDIHRFHLRIDHAHGRITGVKADALRHPWSACPGATEFIARELEGKLLEEVARQDPFRHCTHLIDLAIVCAAHAGDGEPTQFDMKVTDPAGERKAATLAENGTERMCWNLEGTTIAGPEPFAGRDLRKLSQWKHELTAGDAERATMLRRAVFISGGRQFVASPGLKAVDLGPGRMGACFNYQLPQAEQSTRTPNWLRDWSGSNSEPLAGLDAAAVFAEMG